MTASDIRSVLIVTATADQDYAIDHLCAGLQAQFGAKQVRWNPYKPHLGGRSPTDAELPTHVRWSSHDNWRREWGSWSDGASGAITDQFNVADFDLTLVSPPRTNVTIETIEQCRRANRQVAIVDGSDVTDWRLLEAALPNGPWFTRQVHPHADPRALPLEYAVPLAASNRLYRQRDRIYDVIYAGARHGGYRDDYVRKLCAFDRSFVYEGVLPYPHWADLLTRSRVAACPLGANYVHGFEARTLEALAFGCAVVTTEPKTFHAPVDGLYFYRDGDVNTFGHVVNLAVGRGPKPEAIRQSVFDVYAPVMVASRFLDRFDSWRSS